MRSIDETRSESSKVSDRKPPISMRKKLSRAVSDGIENDIRWRGFRERVRRERDSSSERSDVCFARDKLNDIVENSRSLFNREKKFVERDNCLDRISQVVGRSTRERSLDRFESSLDRIENVLEEFGRAGSLVRSRSASRPTSYTGKLHEFRNSLSDERPTRSFDRVPSYDGSQISGRHSSLSQCSDSEMSQDAVHELQDFIQLADKTQALIDRLQQKHRRATSRENIPENISTDRDTYLKTTLNDLDKMSKFSTPCENFSSSTISSKSNYSNIPKHSTLNSPTLSDKYFDYPSSPDLPSTSRLRPDEINDILNEIREKSNKKQKKVLENSVSVDSENKLSNFSANTNESLKKTSQNVADVVNVENSTSDIITDNKANKMNKKLSDQTTIVSSVKVKDKNGFTEFSKDMFGLTSALKKSNEPSFDSSVYPKPISSLNNNSVKSESKLSQIYSKKESTVGLTSASLKPVAVSSKSTDSETVLPETACHRAVSEDLSIKVGTDARAVSNSCMSADSGKISTLPSANSESTQNSILATVGKDVSSTNSLVNSVSTKSSKKSWKDSKLESINGQSLTSTESQSSLLKTFINDSNITADVTDKLDSKSSINCLSERVDSGETLTHSKTSFEKSNKVEVKHCETSSSKVSQSVNNGSISGIKSSKKAIYSSAFLNSKLSKPNGNVADQSSPALSKQFDVSSGQSSVNSSQHSVLEQSRKTSTVSNSDLKTFQSSVLEKKTSSLNTVEGMPVAEDKSKSQSISNASEMISVRESFSATNSAKSQSIVTSKCADKGFHLSNDIGCVKHSFNANQEMAGNLLKETNAHKMVQHDSKSNDGNSKICELENTIVFPTSSNRDQIKTGFDDGKQDNTVSNDRLTVNGQCRIDLDSNITNDCLNKEISDNLVKPVKTKRVKKSSSTSVTSESNPKVTKKKDVKSNSDIKKASSPKVKNDEEVCDITRNDTNSTDVVQNKNEISGSKDLSDVTVTSGVGTKLTTENEFCEIATNINKVSTDKLSVSSDSRESKYSKKVLTSSHLESISRSLSSQKFDNSKKQQKGEDVSVKSSLGNSEISSNDDSVMMTECTGDMRQSTETAFTSKDFSPLSREIKKKNEQKTNEEVVKVFDKISETMTVSETGDITVVCNLKKRNSLKAKTDSTKRAEFHRSFSTPEEATAKYNQSNDVISQNSFVKPSKDDNDKKNENGTSQSSGNRVVRDKFEQICSDKDSCGSMAKEIATENSANTLKSCLSTDTDSEKSKHYNDNTKLVENCACVFNLPPPIPSKCNFASEESSSKIVKKISVKKLENASKMLSQGASCEVVGSKSQHLCYKSSQVKRKDSSQNEVKTSSLKSENSCSNILSSTNQTDECHINSKAHKLEDLECGLVSTDFSDNSISIIAKRINNISQDINNIDKVASNDLKVLKNEMTCQSKTVSTQLDRSACEILKKTTRERSESPKVPPKSFCSREPSPKVETRVSPTKSLEAVRKRFSPKIIEKNSRENSPKPDDIKRRLSPKTIPSRSSEIVRRFSPKNNEKKNHDEKMKSPENREMSPKIMSFPVEVKRKGSPRTCNVDSILNRKWSPKTVNENNNMDENRVKTNGESIVPLRTSPLKCLASDRIKKQVSPKKDLSPTKEKSPRKESSPKKVVPKKEPSPVKQMDSLLKPSCHDVNNVDENSKPSESKVKRKSPSKSVTNLRADSILRKPISFRTDLTKFGVIQQQFQRRSIKEKDFTSKSFGTEKDNLSTGCQLDETKAGKFSSDEQGCVGVTVEQLESNVSEDKTEMLKNKSVISDSSAMDAEKKSDECVASSEKKTLKKVKVVRKVKSDTTKSALENLKKPNFSNIPVRLSDCSDVESPLRNNPEKNVKLDANSSESKGEETDVMYRCTDISVDNSSAETSINALKTESISSDTGVEKKCSKSLLSKSIVDKKSRSLKSSVDKLSCGDSVKANDSKCLDDIVPESTQVNQLQVGSVSKSGSNSVLKKFISCKSESVGNEKVHHESTFESMLECTSDPIKSQQPVVQSNRNIEKTEIQRYNCQDKSGAETLVDIKPKESRIEKTIKSLRRNSFGQSDVFTESKLLKRATSMEDFNDCIWDASGSQSDEEVFRKKKKNKIRKGSVYDAIHARILNGALSKLENAKDSKKDSESSAHCLKKESAQIDSVDKCDSKVACETEMIESLSKDSGEGFSASCSTDNNSECLSDIPTEGSNEVEDRIKRKSYYSRFNPSSSKSKSANSKRHL